MSKRKPIAGVIASVLNLILVLICVNVIYIWAKTKNETGVEPSITQVVVEQTRQFYDDVTTAWTAKKDTAK